MGFLMAACVLATVCKQHKLCLHISVSVRSVGISSESCQEGALAFAEQACKAAADKRFARLPLLYAVHCIPPAYQPPQSSSI